MAYIAFFSPFPWATISLARPATIRARPERPAPLPPIVRVILSAPNGTPPWTPVLFYTWRSLPRLTYDRFGRENLQVVRNTLMDRSRGPLHNLSTFPRPCQSLDSTISKRRSSAPPFDRF